ncbi:MAG: hypothetical protein A2X93_04860 [Deltaproteobacteria bacterium GWC2_56_8]|nr:MAG: hypothetical protein A2X99_10045 [Deltaproteobacteria bacterium GWB2_55_19]OGP36849.1 MAG: hypothetical protein A2X93_04860 [Deltaproteobacteria bacterium GWC2_56_8]
MRNALKLWLVKNRCPVFENGREDRLIDAWAREKAVREPLLDSYMDIADDLTVALELGVVRYPKRINGEFVHDGDDGSVIPVDVARNIFALCEKRANEGERGLELTNEITRLERKAVETLLRKGDFNDRTDGRTDAGHNQAGRR